MSGIQDTPDGPCEELVAELREKARAAGVLTPHIMADATHLSQHETATMLIRSGLSPPGPVACNTMAPDEDTMYLLGHVATEAQEQHFLKPLVEGRALRLLHDRSHVRMRRRIRFVDDENRLPEGSDTWIINGRKAFITGADGVGQNYLNGILIVSLRERFEISNQIIFMATTGVTMLALGRSAMIFGIFVTRLALRRIAASLSAQRHLALQAEASERAIPKILD